MASKAGTRAVPIGDAVRQFIERSGLKRRFPRKGLSDAWRAAAGADVARRSRVLGLNARGQLSVEISGAALLGEVNGFRKAEILEKFRAEMPGLGVRDLVVRPGKF